MTDPIIEWMREERIPLSMENYLHLAYLGNPPKELDAEVICEIEDAIDAEFLRQVGIYSEEE
jgi:hypothetical protein